MNQPNFADLEYQSKKRGTRRELYLERMDGVKGGGTGLLKKSVVVNPGTCASLASSKVEK